MMKVKGQRSPGCIHQLTSTEESDWTKSPSLRPASAAGRARSPERVGEVTVELG